MEDKLENYILDIEILLARSTLEEVRLHDAQADSA